MPTPSTLLHFRVADIVFAVDYRYTDNPRRLLPAYRKFFLPSYEGAVDMHVTVAPALVHNEAEGKEMGQFDTGGAVHGVFLLAEGGYKFQLRDLRGNIAAAVRTDACFSQIEATLTDDDYSRAYGLNNTLMICFAYCAAYRNTLLMHASVVERDGRAYLFLGKSGTGKSTHTQLWIRHLRGSRLLNDDNPALRVMDDGQVKVFGTPWSGKTPCYINASRPVGAIVRLEQWKENIIVRESVVSAFADILTSASTMMWDKPSYDRICQSCTEVISRVPVYHLRNLPNEAAVRLSHDTISQSL